MAEISSPVRRLCFCPRVLQLLRWCSQQWHCVCRFHRLVPNTLQVSFVSCLVSSRLRVRSEVVGFGSLASPSPFVGTENVAGSVVTVPLFGCWGLGISLPFPGCRECRRHPRDCAWVLGPTWEPKHGCCLVFVSVGFLPHSPSCVFLGWVGLIHLVVFTAVWVASVTVRCSHLWAWLSCAVFWWPCRLVWCFPSLTCFGLVFFCLLSCPFCSSDLTRVTLSSPSCTCVWVFAVLVVVVAVAVAVVAVVAVSDVAFDSVYGHICEYDAMSH